MGDTSLRAIVDSPCECDGKAGAGTGTDGGHPAVAVLTGPLPWPGSKVPAVEVGRPYRGVPAGPSVGAGDRPEEARGECDRGPEEDRGSAGAGAGPGSGGNSRGGAAGRYRSRHRLVDYHERGALSG